MTQGNLPAVRFLEVSRYYGAVRAVDGVSFDISDGEFFSLLGPSGSGKTTCLRLIAGFEQPNAGAVLIHGRNTKDEPFRHVFDSSGVARTFPGRYSHDRQMEFSGETGIGAVQISLVTTCSGYKMITDWMGPNGAVWWGFMEMRRQSGSN